VLKKKRGNKKDNLLVLLFAFAQSLFDFPFTRAMGQAELNKKQMECVVGD